MYKRVPGTKDILPEEALRWQKIETLARNIFSLYNYQEIRLPLIEEEALFNRSLGESAEIVQKQMFLIKNKEDTYALRPEGTAAVVRAYLENNLDKERGFVKLYYIGPMFRLERPQKGRLRQFNHIGVEAIGSCEAGLDIEVIGLAAALLNEFGVSGYKIKLNSLGCLKDKQGLSADLQKKLKSKLAQLCPDCRLRFKKNPLRILDCKNEACQEIIRALEIHNTCLCPECQKHFAQVTAGLDALEISYEISPYLVRGLDYYTRTVFEVSHPDLGAQDALAAGGRYDNLVKELGGQDSAAIGFALGIERLMLINSIQQPAVERKKLTYLITLGEEAKRSGLKILGRLRADGISCDTDYEARSLKGALRKANDLNAKFVLIIGENELKNNSATLKDMETSRQKEVPLERLAEELKC